MPKLLITFLKLLSYLPLWILHGLSWLVYLLLFYVFQVRKALTLNNIKAAFPELTEAECLALAKKHYKSTCMVLAESIKGLHLSREDIKKRVKFNNVALLKNYLDKGQSVVILGAHVHNKLIIPWKRPTELSGPSG